MLNLGLRWLKFFPEGRISNRDFYFFQTHTKTTYLAHLFDAVHGVALELSELARKEIITSKSKILDVRKALYDKLKRADKKATGFPSSIGELDTMYFDNKHTGPAAFEVVNLVVGILLVIIRELI